MNRTIVQQLADLQRLPNRGLRARYVEVFGEQTPSKNRTWLIRRLAWRLQALAEGGLSERARQRAAELANDADLRMNPPAASPTAPELTSVQTVEIAADERLPPPGTILTREYKGATIRVQVLPKGFAYEGQVFRSLSAVAKAVTGSHCNGFLFFKLTNHGGAA